VNESNIRVVRMEERGVYVPIVCSQCEPAYCMAACPSGAITRDVGTGAVLISKSFCTRCRACVVACPFGAINIGRDVSVLKCDLCEGEPYCVRFCATDALKYVDATRSLLKKRARSAVTVAAHLVPDKETYLRKIYYTKVK
jgi:Fe-S-cluster-containing hydrogenase component 2